MKFKILMLLMLFILPVMASGEIYINYINENVTHVHTEGTNKQDWYYTGECLNQISNLYDQPWEKVNMGISYGDTFQEVITNYNEFEDGYTCDRTDITDNETFVNLTAFKDFTYLGKNLRITREEYIEDDSEYMQQSYKFKSYDEINQNVWFVLHRSEITVANDSANDVFKISYKDGTYSYIDINNHIGIDVYNGNDLLYAFWLEDTLAVENIMFAHNVYYNDWGVIIKNSDIYFVFKAGTFDANEEKILKTWWVDAKCSCDPLTTLAEVGILDFQDDANVGDQFTMTCVIDWIAGTGCTGSQMNFNDNTSIFAPRIPIDDIDLDCSGDLCAISNPSDVTFYNKTIDVEGTGQYLLHCNIVCGTISWSGDTSPFIYLNVPEKFNISFTFEPPTNNSELNTTTEFFFNLTDVDDADCDVILNDDSFTTFSGLSDGTFSFNVTPPQFYAGVNNFTLLCTDGFNNETEDKYILFTPLLPIIDFINWVQFSNNQNFEVNTSTIDEDFNFNVSCSGDFLTSMEIIINNEAIINYNNLSSNIEGNNYINDGFFNFEILTNETIHNMSVICIDDFALNVTQNVHFYVDQPNEEIILNIPLGTVFNVSGANYSTFEIVFNYTPFYTPHDTDNCTLYINNFDLDTNLTPISNQGNTFKYNLTVPIAGLIDTWNWKISCTDAHFHAPDTNEQLTYFSIESTVSIHNTDENTYLFGYEIGTCPNNTTSQVMMFIFMVSLLFTFYIFNETYMKLPIVGLLTAMGFMFMGFIMYSCHVIFGWFNVIFGVMLFAWELFR